MHLYAKMSLIEFVGAAPTPAAVVKPAKQRPKKAAPVKEKSAPKKKTVEKQASPAKKPSAKKMAPKKGNIGAKTG